MYTWVGPGANDLAEFRTTSDRAIEKQASLLRVSSLSGGCDPRFRWGNGGIGGVEVGLLLAKSFMLYALLPVEMLVSFYGYGLCLYFGSVIAAHQNSAVRSPKFHRVHHMYKNRSIHCYTLPWRMLSPLEKILRLRRHAWEWT